MVFPPQGLLQPSDRQMIRIQWVGGPLESSRGYYVSIDQLPVQLDPAKADKHKASVDVQLIYRMKVLVTVAPPGAAAKVAVESVRPVMVSPPKLQGIDAPDASPVPGVEVTVTNSGKRYAMMAGAAWTIQGKGIDGKPLKVVLSSNDMSRVSGRRICASAQWPAYVRRSDRRRIRRRPDHRQVFELIGDELPAYPCDHLAVPSRCPRSNWLSECRGPCHSPRHCGYG